MGCNPLTWIVDSVTWAYRKIKPIENYRAYCSNCRRIRNSKGEFYITSMSVIESYKNDPEARKENCPDHPDCLEKRLAGDYNQSESE